MGEESFCGNHWIGFHTVEDIVEQLVPLLQGYGMVRTLGVFISDNADVNDVAIQSTLVLISSNMISRVACSGWFRKVEVRELQGTAALYVALVLAI
jgi:hypothetical protein